MDKRHEAEQKWNEYARIRAFNYNIYLKALHDYKSALREDVKKKFVLAGIPRDELTLTMKELFDLIDEVTPK